MTSLLRLLQIYQVLSRYGLERLLAPLHRARHLRLLLWLTPWVFLSPKRHIGTEAERVRDALIELGPIYVKFGQMLSTRRDILPSELADALACLQDKVPPFATSQVERILQTAYQKPIDQLFAAFERTPLASASVAQVHAATLKTGEDVVVKILRPDIEPRIKADIQVMKTIASIGEKYSHEARRLHLKDVVLEYEKTIYDELDLVREAGNGSQLRRNFEGSPLLYVPKMYWDYARDNVIVMERIYGIPVTDISALKAAHIDLKSLAERGVEIFFTQVFVDNFFHADMHPGNIFVNPKSEGAPQYMCVDFGIIGSLSDADKDYLGENMLAFFRRDYRQVAKLHINSGWLNRDTRIEEFEGAVRSACEPIFEKPLSQISFGNLLLRLIKISRRYGYEVQPQLVLLQKTLLNVEGLGRQLYPDLDLWQTAKPILEKWIKERSGVGQFYANLRRELPSLIGDLPLIAPSLKAAVEQIASGTLRLASSDELQQIKRQQQLSAKKAARATLASMLALAATIFALLVGNHVAYALHASVFLGALALLLILKNSWNG